MPTAKKKRATPMRSTQSVVGFFCGSGSSCGLVANKGAPARHYSITIQIKCLEITAQQRAANQNNAPRRHGVREARRKLIRKVCSGSNQSSILLLSNSQP